MCVRAFPAAADAIAVAIATVGSGQICLSLVTIVQANHLFKCLAIVLFAVRKRQESKYSPAANAIAGKIFTNDDEIRENKKVHLDVRVLIIG